MRPVVRIDCIQVCRRSRSIEDSNRREQAARFGGLAPVRDMTGVFPLLRCQRLGVFVWLVLQGARALVLFVFEPSNVFLGIGEALQACFEDGGIRDLM
jgi:hypothetical protein